MQMSSFPSMVGWCEPHQFFSFNSMMSFFFVERVNDVERVKVTLIYYLYIFYFISWGDI